MNKRNALSVLMLLAFITAAVHGQQTAMVPVIDGMAGAGEYQLNKTGSGIDVGFTPSADGKTLYLSVKAPTAGWVALGVGSLKMDGAFMVIAFDANGTPTVSEQTGKGHGHKPNPANILIASAVKEANGVTTLEVALPAEGHTSGNTLKMIAAYGKADSLTSLHRGYTKAEFSY